MDGKSQAWRDAADKLLEALAKENKYIVSDMVQVFLESAGYGLDDYSPLGGVFKRAAKRGIISKVDRPTKQALWYSKIYSKHNLQTVRPVRVKIPPNAPDINIGRVIHLENFGPPDGPYRVLDNDGENLKLEAIDE